MECLENRNATRYSCEVPVKFIGGTGVTRDYSTDGAYITTDRIFVLGEQLEFVMCLTNQDPTKIVALTCQAEVVRVEQVEGKMGTAVSIIEYAAELVSKKKEEADSRTKSQGITEPVFKYSRRDPAMTGMGGTFT